MPAAPAVAIPNGKRSGNPKTETAFDDDGEARGGAAIRAELNAKKALGVAVVVTRFYGGVNIGKARFEHIRERTAAMLKAAGCVEGVMAESDAWRGAGRALGGGGDGTDALAAALGGIPRPALVPRAPPPPPARVGGAKSTPTPTTARGAGGRASTREGTGRGRGSRTSSAVSAATVEDVRRRMAEAAERRAARSAAAAAIRETTKMTAGPGEGEAVVIDLCGDDSDADDASPAGKRARCDD